MHNIMTDDLLNRFEKTEGLVFPIGSYPISQLVLEAIDQAVSSTEISAMYEHVVKGDTAEAHDAYVLRLIKDKHQYVQDTQSLRELAIALEQELFSSEMQRLFSRFAPATTQINRMQVNLLKAGGFVGEHRDNDDQNSYTLVAILNLSGSYEGGLYHIAPEGSDELVLKLNFGDLLISTATVSHRVATVTKGERKTLVCFLGEK